MMETDATFSSWLNQNTLVRIGRSELHGVGVFALQDIPHDTDPFPGIRKRHQLVEMTAREVEALKEPARQMVKDFCIPSESGVYYVYKNGFASMDASFYMNSSDNGRGNVGPVYCRGSTLTGFRTLRRVNAGEELLFQYSLY